MLILMQRILSCKSFSLKNSMHDACMRLNQSKKKKNIYIYYQLKEIFYINHGFIFFFSFIQFINK